MNIVQYESINKDGLELVVDKTSGEVFASVKATARMCETSDSNVRYICTAQQWQLKTAEIQTGAGLRTAQLLNESQILECIAKYNVPLLVQCTKAGLRVFLYGVVGYQQPVTTKLPTSKELAYLVIAAEEAREKAEAKALALSAKIEADEGATALGKLIESAERNNVRIGEFAKVLGLGQNKYFEELRECQIITVTSTLPYQRFLTAGYFVVTQIQNNNKWYPVALITPKGKAYLAKRHKKHLASMAIERIIEAEVEALV
jgi:phage antirepressor YoqD-like protein